MINCCSCLQVLRGVSGRDDGGRALADGSDLVQLLCSEGLAKTLLGMLAQLEPITAAGRRPREGGDARGAPVEIPAVPGVPLGTWPGSQPYEGYRSDIVSGESTHMNLFRNGHRISEPVPHIADFICFTVTSSRLI